MGSWTCIITSASRSPTVVVWGSADRPKLLASVLGAPRVCVAHSRAVPPCLFVHTVQPQWRRPVPGLWPCWRWPWWPWQPSLSSHRFVVFRASARLHVLLSAAGVVLRGAVVVACAGAVRTPCVTPQPASPPAPRGGLRLSHRAAWDPGLTDPCCAGAASCRRRVLRPRRAVAWTARCWRRSSGR